MCVCGNCLPLHATAWLTFLPRWVGWWFTESLSFLPRVARGPICLQLLVVSGGRSFCTPALVTVHVCGVFTRRPCCAGSMSVVPLWMSLLTRDRRKWVVPVESQSKMYQRIVKASFSMPEEIWVCRCLSLQLYSRSHSIPGDDSQAEWMLLIRLPFFPLTILVL